MYFFKGEEVDLILFGFVDYDRSSLVYDKQVKNGGGGGGGEDDEKAGAEVETGEDHE